MKLDDLIKIVSAGYPDDLVQEYYFMDNKETPEIGDTLALFISREVKDTYDEAATDLEQLLEVHRAIERAQLELGAVLKTVLKSIESIDKSHSNKKKLKKRGGK